MRFSSLAEWLNWQEGLHPSTIELGLDRISRVFQRLQATSFSSFDSPPCPVITVAGTNGKGSSVAMLESIYQNAGYQTGVFTSPHLLRYNERIHLNGEEVSDQTICEAFDRIDMARCDRARIDQARPEQAYLENNEEISLTYFEFATLAALDIFYRAKPDVMILEVGLGGRLDGVNILDADVALITSIGIDHTAWLGEDRETIGKEKAGIMRKHRPVIYSDSEMPESIENAANLTQAALYRLGKDFDWQNGMAGESCISWDWTSDNMHRTALPLPNIRGRHQLNNASGVLMVLQCLADKLPVNQKQIKAALLSVTLPGRFQCILGNPVHILDVAHNTDSMACLAELLQGLGSKGKNIAVVGMLEDKAHADALARMLPVISKWYLADLDVPHGAKASQLADALISLDSHTRPSCFSHIRQALEAADVAAEINDHVVIFGSFYTVALAMQLGIQ